MRLPTSADPAASPRDADAIMPTLYDPEEFAALYHADKERPSEV